MKLVIRAHYPSGTKVLAMTEAAEICFQCGVCCVVKGHSCHVMYDEQFTPCATYVYDCLGADEATANPNIWLCVSCHKCEEVCPYEVSPIKFIEAVKARALMEGNAHPIIHREMNNVVSTGYAFPLTTASERQRKRLNLEPLKTSSAIEVRLLAERTGLTRMLKMHEGEKS